MGTDQKANACTAVCTSWIKIKKMKEHRRKIKHLKKLATKYMKREEMIYKTCLNLRKCGDVIF